MKKRLFICFLLILAAALCLACAASAAGTVTLGDRLVYDTGRTKISWDVSGSDADTYKVYVQVVDNGSSKQSLVYVGETTNHTIRTTQCIPGLSYEVTIRDGSNNILAQKTYKMDDPVIFEDGKLKDTSIKISVEPRKLKNGDMITKDTKKINNLKAVEIMEGIDENTYSYGVKYTMKMPQLVKERAFFVTIAFESPDGYVYVWYADDLEFARVNRGYQTIWFYMAGSDFFRELYSLTGEVPTGTYNIFAFWDGMWVSKISFNVR